jgi:hypothetical protein
VCEALYQTMLLMFSSMLSLCLVGKSGGTPFSLFLPLFLKFGGKNYLSAGNKYLDGFLLVISSNRWRMGFG